MVYADFTWDGGRTQNLLFDTTIERDRCIILRLVLSNINQAISLKIVVLDRKESRFVPLVGNPFGFDF